MSNYSEHSPRPEYATCIAHTHAKKIGTSWCGRDIRTQFAFQNIDHAAYSQLNGDRLTPCDDCMQAIIEGAFDLSLD